MEAHYTRERALLGLFGWNEDGNQSVLKVDLHLHTAEDPVDNIGYDAVALIDRAAVLGFDALAITLHDKQLAEAWLSDYARERGIVLLPGMERTIQGKHVLLINFPQSAERVRTFEDVARLKERSNGLVIAPHPFFPDRACLRSFMDRYVDLFDAVEWSYFWTRATNFNARAERWALSHGKAVVGNSDLHDIRQLGRTHSWVSAEPDADAICHAIRDGRVSFNTQPVPVLELACVLGGMLLPGRKRPTSAAQEIPPENWTQLKADG
jgi:predicted metal-dependent phosphoesterase TrpH